MNRCISCFLLLSCVSAWSHSAHAAVIAIDGTIKSVDAKNRTITVDTGKESKTLDVSSKAKVTAEGKEAALESLKPGQNVKLSYHDELEIVLKIDVVFSQPGKDEWHKLSEGDSLDGWIGNKRYWRIKDGVIEGQQPNGVQQNNLFTRSKFRNFTLKAKVKVLDGNSGILFRAEPGERGGTKTAYQMDIRTLRASDRNGMLTFDQSLGEVALTPTALDQLKRSFNNKDWNDCEIVADGKRIRLQINGITTVETEDKRFQAGSIGFQMSGEAHAMFKDVQIKVLP